MSSTVDRRIVEMQFENKNFERNAQQSIETMEELRKSLNFDSSADSLREFEKQTKDFKMENLVKAAEAVTEKFSIMGTIADQVLRRIGDAAYGAINKMKGFVESFTTQPIQTGLQEYETQINAIQTILSNTRAELTKKGYDDAQRLDIVNEKLDQLNHYADKTIYNFTEMTRNIGTFTAAGVELDTAVNAIQGIANLAAVSGSTSEQASRGMYQLSQALASGRVRLMDWRSVVNAGMGGEVFKEALIRTATAMNVTVEDTVKETAKNGKTITKTVHKTVEQLIADEGSFEESLSTGWLSADVLTATLEQFSWDFEQMAEDTVLDDERRKSLVEQLTERFIGEGNDAETALKKAEEIVGDTTNLSVEAVKEIKKAELLASGYTSAQADEIIQLADDARKAATEVKTLTQLLGTLREAAQSGWTQTWEYIIGDFNEAREFLTGLSDYFSGIINRSADARNQIFKEWHDKGGRDSLFNNDPEKGPLGAIWNFIYAIQNVIDNIKAGFTKIVPPITSDTLLGISSTLQSITARFREWTENPERAEKIRKIAEGIGAEFEILKTLLNTVWGWVRKIFNFAAPSMDSILNVFSTIAGYSVKIKEWLNDSEKFKAVGEKFSEIWTTVKTAATDAFNSVRDWFVKLWDKMGVSSKWESLKKWFSDIWEKVPDALDKVNAWVNAVIDYVKNSETLQNAWSNTKKFFDDAINGIVAFSKKLWTAVKGFFNADMTGKETFWDKLKVRFTAFFQPFGGWFDTVKGAATSAWNSVKAFFTNFFTKTIPEFFTQTVPKFFTETLPNFFNQLRDGVGKAFDGVKNLDWNKIIGYLKTLAGVYAAFKVVRGIASFGAGVKKAGAGLKKIGKGIKKIGKGIEELGENGLKLKAVDSVGTTLLKIGAAIGILVGSIYLLSKLDTYSVIKGIGLLSVLMLEMTMLSFILRSSQNNGRVFLNAAKGILVMLIPIYLLGRMKTEDALKGILGVGAILLELSLFTRIAKNTQIKGLLILSIAMNILVLAVKNLGSLRIDKLAKGLGGLAILFLELRGFMKTAGGSIKISGILGLSIGILLLAKAVEKMGNLKISTIAKGVIGLGGIMKSFSLLTKEAKGMKLGNSLVMLLTMAGSMLIFVEIFKQVQGMDTTSMLEFAGSFALGLISVAASMFLFSKIPITGALTGLAAFVISIAGIIGIAAGLKYLIRDWTPLISALNSLGDFLGAFGRAIGMFIGGIGGGILEGLTDGLPQIGTYLSDFMNNAGDFISGAKKIDGSVATGVGELANAIGKIASSEFKAWLVEAFSGENPITKFTKDIIKLGVALSAYGIAIKPLEKVPQTALNRSVKLAESLTDISDKIKGDGSFMQLIGAVGTMDDFTTDMGTLASGLADFATEVNKLEIASIDDGKLTAVTTVASNLATLEGKINEQTGLKTAIFGMRSLESFGSSFPAFAEGLNEFFAQVRQIDYDPDKTGNDAKKMDAIIEIAGKLAVLEKNLQGQGGIEQDFTGIKSLKFFGEELDPFAQNLNKFVAEIRKIEYDPNGKDATKMNAMLELATSLSTLEKNIEGQGGVEDWFTGVQSLANFGEELPDFAGNLNGFIAQVRQIDYDPNPKGSDASHMAAIIAIAEQLAILEKTLEPQGGVEDWWFGSKDLGTYGRNIKTLGDALASFMNDIGGLSLTQSGKAFIFLKAFELFMNELKPTGGLLQILADVFGEGNSTNTLNLYAEKMKQFGESLSAFAKGAKDIEGVSVDPSTGLLESFLNWAATVQLPKEFSTGLFDASWLGNKWTAIEKAANAVKQIGTSVGIFADNASKVKEADSSFELIKALFENFRNFNTTVSGWTDVEMGRNLKSLLSSIEDYGGSIQQFTFNANNADFEDVKAASDLLGNLASAYGALAFSDPFEADPIQAMLDSLSTVVIPEFNTEGIENAKAYINALTDEVGSAEALSMLASAITGLSEDGTAAADGTYDAWHATGSYLGAGLREGIRSMASSIQTAAQNAAAGAIHAIRISWAINSPSKVGAELGRYFDLGIAGGLSDYATKVSDSAAGMAESVVKSAKTLLRGNEASIFDYIDPNPVIRPVMDLTNLQNGIVGMNGMLRSAQIAPVDLFRGANAQRSIGGISTESGRISGRTTDQNIVGRLDALSDRIGELGEAVTNMQIVLDSGELVGATTSKMDASLGRTYMRRRRGS